MVKVNVNSLGTDIIVVGVVNKYDTNSGLLHFTNAFYSVTFSSSSAVMALDAGNSLSFPNDLSYGTVCGTSLPANTFTITAPNNGIFDKILFASYGTPTGTCENFAIGGCHASNTETKLAPLLLGQNTLTLTYVQQDILFGDPCMGVNKSLYVWARFYYKTGANLTKIEDLTNYNNDGNFNNGVYYDSAGGGSLAFDGTNDYVVVSNSSTNNPSDNFTVQFWFLPKAAVTKTFIAKYTGGFQGWVFGFNINTISFDGRNLTADGYKQAISSVPLTLNNWYYIVGVKSGTNMYIYQNGVLTGSTTWTTPGDMSTSNNISLGNYAGDYLQCNITDFRMYTRVLSATEISAYYNASKSRYGL
jgi:hypothetical protein